MTVETSIVRTTYNGAGTTGPFGSPPFDLVGDLLVQRSVSGVVTTLVLGTDYTVTGGGAGSAGNVTLTTALAAGQALEIINDPFPTQALDLADLEDFPADAVERALDRLTFIALRLRDQVTGIVELGGLAEKDQVEAGDYAADSIAEADLSAAVRAKLNDTPTVGSLGAKDQAEAGDYTANSIDEAALDAAVRAKLNATLSIADDSVTLAMLASGSPGRVIGYDSDGNPAELLFTGGGGGQPLGALALKDLVEVGDYTPDSIVEVDLSPAVRAKLNDTPTGALAAQDQVEAGDYASNSIVEADLSAAVRAKLNDTPTGALADLDLVTEADLSAAVQTKLNQAAGTNTITFNASGTYTPSANAIAVLITAWGAGGGGQGANPGDGGGGGGVIAGLYLASQLSSSHSISIGAGGSVNAAGGSTTVNGLLAAGGGAPGNGTRAGGSPSVTLKPALGVFYAEEGGAGEAVGGGNNPGNAVSAGAGGRNGQQLTEAPSLGGGDGGAAQQDGEVPGGGGGGGAGGIVGAGGNGRVVAVEFLG